jgi:hypothetical protein
VTGRVAPGHGSPYVDNSGNIASRGMSMAGMRIASTDGAGWTVEIVELTLTRRRTAPRRTPGGSPAPLGDGGRSRIPASQDSGFGARVVEADACR